MVKFERGNKEFYINILLKQNLDFTIKQVHDKDWDMLFVIDGAEGAGKSTLAQQLAVYVDPDFCTDRIAFTPDEFKKKVVNGRKGQAVIWDEAMAGANVRATISNVNKAIVDLLAEIRQKNLFIFVVLPSFFDLDKYVALWRARALIHVYHKAFNRGHFSFYNEDKKKYLYVQGKKFYNYHCQKPNFRGNFFNGYAVDEQEYRESKLKALRAANPGNRVAPLHKRWLDQRDCAWYILTKELNWSVPMVVQAYNRYDATEVDDKTIYAGISRFRRLISDT